MFSWIINEREFFRTNGRVRFFPSSCWSFMPSFGKILRLVFRENCLQTNRPTDQPTIPSLTSTVVENWNVLADMLNFSLLTSESTVWLIGLLRLLGRLGLIRLLDSKRPYSWFVMFNFLILWISRSNRKDWLALSEYAIWNQCNGTISITWPKTSFLARFCINYANCA